MLASFLLVALAAPSGKADPIVALREMRERCADIRWDAAAAPLQAVSGQGETYRLILGDHYGYRWWTYTAELNSTGGTLTVKEWVGEKAGREARIAVTYEQSERIRRLAREHGFWLGLSDTPPDSGGFRAMMRTVMREGETRCAAGLAAIDLRAFAPLSGELSDLGAVYDDLASVEHESTPTARCLRPAHIRGKPGTQHFAAAEFAWVFSGRFLSNSVPTEPRTSRQVETSSGPQIEDTWVFPQEGEDPLEVCFWRPADR